LKPSRRDWLKLLLFGFALMAMTATAAPIINNENPVCFFTNVASRLLSTELNVNLTRIEIYPTNQFTPAVHRLLQVTANIYDASTNRYYDLVPSTNMIALPTVFQPVFGVENGYVYITNFIEVTNLNVFNNTIRNLNYGPSVVAALQPDDLVFGVPLIIGAKKGFPNFNEFFMEDTFQLVRKLLVTRPSTNVPVPIPAGFFNYYEQFSLSLSNHFGVEMWNSYRSNYTRPTDIYVTNYITMTLTNDEGNFSFANNLVASGYLHFDSTTPWPAYNAYFPTSSFQIPLATNFPAVPSSVYLFNSFAPPQLTTNLAVQFQTNYPTTYGQYPQPHWGLTVTNNLQVIMVDSISGRLIDYVQLSGPNSSRDLTAEIENEYAGYGTDTGYNNLWNTNLFLSGMPIGITDQLKVSQGYGIPVYNATLWGQSQKTVYDQMNAFRIFTMGKNTFLLLYPGYVADPVLMSAAASAYYIQAPFSPATTVVQDITWQANDPLVHYLASDLYFLSSIGLSTSTRWPGNLGNINQHYMAWGGNPYLPSEDTSPYNVAIKDPLVYSSDNWNFPDGQPLNPDWIGQVHRGTPWQTIYLKASDILNNGGINTWINWTGDLDTNDAAAMAPVQDRHLASLLASLFNTNNLASLFSVNNPAPNAWQGLLDGLTGSMNIPAQFDSVLISSNSSQASAIANAIESERVSKPGQFFSDVGDILATPQLVEQSPFLAGASSNIVSDADYEIIPSQLLSLLRADSVGSAALINGQPLVQFTGYNGHLYAIEISSNLVNWVSITTNYPVNGVLSYTNSTMLNSNQEFYRSNLLQ
jgi:hypothetical protein